ncbi:hypothetical protein Pcinc_039444 [Petrolisthes cinctipes]|uniref:Uncharacterized protein n=1 Tax=Petrolisthes cinctipes TaxID=88211 RepID=A0AAE1BNJ1_PETCI|nr:hypothetical protein Pcinc_039444 [Petrolisthes cinctipes]
MVKQLVRSWRAVLKQLIGGTGCVLSRQPPPHSSTAFVIYFHYCKRTLTMSGQIIAPGCSVYIHVQVSDVSGIVLVSSHQGEEVEVENVIHPEVDEPISGEREITPRPWNRRRRNT